MIRRAEIKDIPGIIDLLHQVDMVHHVLRPDLFKPNTTKYNEQELEDLLGDDSKPIFVFEDGTILGHAFCMITEVKGDKFWDMLSVLLQKSRTTNCCRTSKRCISMTSVWMKRHAANTLAKLYMSLSVTMPSLLDATTSP